MKTVILQGGNCVIELIYKTKCNIKGCNNEHIEKFEIGDYDAIPHPSLPLYWHKLEHMIICDKHDITILIDGKG